MKMMKRMISLALVVLVVCSLSVTAFAAGPSVTYLGGAEKFLFLQDDDLFDGFKNVMPGDVLTQSIPVQVNNTYSRTDYVRIYLRAEAHDENNAPVAGVTAEASNALLQYMTLQVYNGSKLIYEDTADQEDGLRNNVLLGEFKKGQGTTLTAVLTVDPELPNGFMHKLGEVDWVFTAEEFDKAGTPQTGDDTNVVPYVAALCVSMAAIVVLLVMMKRRKREE